MLEAQIRFIRAIICLFFAYLRYEAFHTIMVYRTLGKDLRDELR